MQSFIVYTRVSTKEQGRSGLGIEAQARDMLLYLGSIEGAPDAPQNPLIQGQNPTDILAQHPHVLATFSDVISGTKDDRPQLALAMAMARKTGATLLVAKLDRLSRSVSFLASLLDDKRLSLTVAAMPTADKFQLHIYAALAEQERTMISARTKAALQAAKARGVKLGGPNLPALNDGQTRRADAHAAKVAKVALPMRRGGATLQAIADALTSAGVRTARGGAWSPSTVMRVLNRLDKQAA